MVNITDAILLCDWSPLPPHDPGEDRWSPRPEHEPRGRAVPGPRQLRAAARALRGHALALLTLRGLLHILLLGHRNLANRVLLDDPVLAVTQINRRQWVHLGLPLGGVDGDAAAGLRDLGHDEGRAGELVALAVVGAVVPRPVPLQVCEYRAVQPRSS